MPPVGWFGTISLAALVLAWLLPYQARIAVALPVAGIPLWLLVWTVAARTDRLGRRLRSLGAGAIFFGH